MVRALGAVAVCLLASSAALAEPNRDIPWFMGHQAAREATLKICRNDHRFARDVTCLNAETAADRAWATQRGQRPMPTEFQTPSFYATNDLTRITTLALCRKHPGVMYSPRTCAAAEAGDRMASVQPR